MSQLFNFVSVLLTFMSPLYAFMSKDRLCSAVSEHTHSCSPYMILTQVNGLPVNTTACGDLTKSLCKGDLKLLNVVERMAGGKTLWTVALHRETKVQLVPRTKHQLLLGAQKDTYTHNEVFGQRSDHRSNGPYHELVKK